MTVELHSRSDITLKVFQRVAWNGETVTIHADTRDAIDSWRAEFEQFLAANPQAKVYGVNIGAGDAAGTKLTTELQAEYLKGLASGTSFGAPLPDRIVRGIVLARLSSFLGGNAAVRSVLADHVAGMLSRPLPTVPAEGNGGSGEIQALGHLFGSVPHELDLAPKEPMALINGSPASSALVADVALRGADLLRAVERVFTMAADAMGTPHEHFASALEDVWEDDDERVALRTIRGLLADAPGPRRDKQALVSIRILPKVLGAAYRAQASAEHVASAALTSVNDNPIFVPAASGRPAAIMSNGSFHNHHAVVAIDGASRIWADLCQVAQALIQGLYTDKVALPGVDNRGLGNVYMVGSAWAEDARAAACPAVLPSPTVGQNDIASPTFHAWNRSERVEHALKGNLALVAALASQSFAVRGVAPAPQLHATLEVIRGYLPPVADQRNLGPELGALSEGIVSGLAAACALSDPQLALAPAL